MLRIAPRPLALAATLGLSLLACVQRPAMVIETATGDVVPLETWSATLSGALHGIVTLAPGVTYRETLATITISGATPRAVHGWYVQLGECGHERGILAGLQPYTPLTADAEGTAAASVAGNRCSTPHRDEPSPAGRAYARPDGHPPHDDRHRAPGAARHRGGALGRHRRHRE